MIQKIKKYTIILLIFSIFIPFNVLAYSDYIIASGENIGIKIKNKGIIIAGFYDINGVSPGVNANLKKGDIIVSVNNKNVNSIEEFVSKVKETNNNNVEIKYIRDNKEYKTNLNIIKENDIYKTGLYVKDTISGIGTLTYIDPDSLRYGALGHEILESQSKALVDVDTGNIYDSKVTSINKSIRGEPGSKSSSTNEEKVYGNVKSNTKKGIFGEYYNKLNDNNKYKVANIDDIKLGEAKILTTLDDNKVKEYKINILKINKNESDTKNILFEITDKELLNKAGGIVQGMSGSPIIQGEYIIGAVNNVIINEPDKGFGIFITSMLKEMESKD